MRTLPPALLATVLLATLSATLVAQEQTDPKKPETKPAAKPDVQATQTQDAAASKPLVLSLGMRASGGIVLKDIDGNEHRAKSYQGKVTVVNFYSTQCPIQAAWDDRLAAIQNEFGKKDVVFLNIDSNRTEIGDQPPVVSGDEKPYDSIRKHLKAKDLPFTVLVDHGNVVADLFGAKTTPDIFVFGKDGKLVYRGLIDDDQAQRKGDQAKRYLHDVLTKLVAGETVEAFETKPQGCSIKRMPKADASGGEPTRRRPRQGRGDGKQ
ncbi:MAG: redoxin domain-containing protein [Planctomycetota bacterium]